MERLRLEFDAPRGPEAAGLRQRRGVLLRQLQRPGDLTAMLPGSLSLSHFRCGKPTCRCARGEGHPAWSLTFMVHGTKQVLHVPAEWVAEMRRRVEMGHAFQDAVREVLAANAQLLVLARKQRRRR